jgi:hypothetical protein
MIDVILIYDGADGEGSEEGGLGYFFTKCAEAAKNILNGFENYTVKELDSTGLSEEAVVKLIESYEHTDHLIIAFSHGTPNELLYDNQTKCYIGSPLKKNIYNGLFYTWSCWAAEELGPDLITNSCKAFIGYNKPVIAGTLHTDKFVSGATHGILGLAEGKTIQETFQAMYDNYNVFIDELTEDYFVASLFRKNRDALLPIGDLNATSALIDKTV